LRPPDVSRFGLHAHRRDAELPRGAKREQFQRHSDPSPSVGAIHAFYTYSGERYELAIFPSGEFFGPPEDAFEISANMYLQ